MTQPDGCPLRCGSVAVSAGVMPRSLPGSRPGALRAPSGPQSNTSTVNTAGRPRQAGPSVAILRLISTNGGQKHGPKKKIVPLPGDNRNGGRDDLFDNSETPEDAKIDTDFDPVKLEAETDAQAPRDPFDPTLLGISQDFAGEAQVAKRWDIIKVEKPSKARVFRVHLDPSFRLKTMLLTMREDNETYLILPALRQALAGESLCGVHTLLACVSKAGTPFLWPIRMAVPDGKWNVWHQSAWQIAEKAQHGWCRMQPNRDAGHNVGEYDQRPPEQQHSPAWPDLAFNEWLRLAFQGFTISSLEHPVLKRLCPED
jgi:hypothetical protein